MMKSQGTGHLAGPSGEDREVSPREPTPQAPLSRRKSVTAAVPASGRRRGTARRALCRRCFVKVKGGGSLELVRAASKRENPGSADLESQDTQYFNVPANKVSLNHFARGRETCRSGAHRSAIPRHADEERSPRPTIPHPPWPPSPPTAPPPSRPQGEPRPAHPVKYVHSTGMFHGTGFFHSKDKPEGLRGFFPGDFC